MSQLLRTISRNINLSLTFLCCVFFTSPTWAAPYQNYSDRNSFSSAVGSTITDNYESTAYQQRDPTNGGNALYGIVGPGILSDAVMSSVLGETKYKTNTYFPDQLNNYNNVISYDGINHQYCSKCYGSFQLSFDSTSLTSYGGVYGVGLDILSNSGSGDNTTYSAFVTFADGSTSNLNLPYFIQDYPYREPIFWGITSTTQISSIDFQTFAYGANPYARTYLSIDNLTIASSTGSTRTTPFVAGNFVEPPPPVIEVLPPPITTAVPEPETYAMMLAGLGVMGAISRRRKAKQMA